MSLRQLIIALTAAIIAASPALAEESSDPQDMLGSWTFQTQTYRNGGGSCSMSGTMTVTSNPEVGLYDCEVTAVEDCEAWGETVVVQSCKVRRTRNQVAVRSIIEQKLKFDVAGLTYIPDNFALTVQSPNLMYGSLISAVNAPVEFRRSLDGIS